ncbi:hypothetical protein HAX54_051245, partial [Datura stramonium]|nr:hypothetical protein [Datura stramonium]
TALVVSAGSEGEEKEDGETSGAPVERWERMFSGQKWSEIMKGEEKKKKRGKATDGEEMIFRRLRGKRRRGEREKCGCPVVVRTVRGEKE